ncbi:hypothetical protein Dsin_018023 [Dipteronia sinensis]|uniref:WAT1-related protein n=1 Tax=Dipteronia sinensis TaxID=43782 RepID=A0AAE0AHG4_9ROSI|nr:hypothetical protein Dsin_018023 [Dipteronia sinensis]
MLIVQVVFASVNVFSKLIANGGISLQVMVACRFIFANMFMVPLALVLERLWWPADSFLPQCLWCLLLLFSKGYGGLLSLL